MIIKVEAAQNRGPTMNRRPSKTPISTVCSVVSGLGAISPGYAHSQLHDDEVDDHLSPEAVRQFTVDLGSVVEFEVPASGRRQFQEGSTRKALAQRLPAEANL